MYHSISMTLPNNKQSRVTQRTDRRVTRLISFHMWDAAVVSGILFLSGSGLGPLVLLMIVLAHLAHLVAEFLLRCLHLEELLLGEES